MKNIRMHCPDLGAWRAWLDHDLAAGSAHPLDDPALANHLAACPACRETVGELRGNASVAAASIASLAVDAVVDAARVEQARLRVARCALVGAGDVRSSDAEQERTAVMLPTSAPSTPAASHATRGPRAPRGGPWLAATARRWRVATGGLAAGLALTLLVGTPTGQTAAAAFLAQFRSQRFAVVTVDPAQKQGGLAQLERLGTVQGDRPSKRAEEVASVEEASRRVGFAVKQADPATLPTSVTKTPKVAVMPSHEARFTFDQDKARAYFQSINRPDVALPDRFHGASLVVAVPAAALLTYERVDDPGLASKHGPGLLIGQARELTVRVEGNVTLDELRTFLLGLPGLPPELKRQVEAIQDWRNTLPIPVPADQVNWREVTIAGGQGLILAENTGLGSAAIWQRDGRVAGIAGSLKVDELQRVADGLR